MASEEDTNSKSPSGIPEFIVYRPWTVQTVAFWFMLACWIPGLQLPKLQKMLAMPGYNMDLVGDWNDRAVMGTMSYYLLWCNGCEITKHPEYFEDRGRALRVLQKVKEREHPCRDMTWSTHDDPAPGLNSTNYVSPSGTVAFIAIDGGSDPRKCSHYMSGYLRDLAGQGSGDVKGGLSSALSLAEGSFGAINEEVMHHQLILLPIMLLLMWNVCGGWWRSLTNIIISSWAAGASNAFLLVMHKINPDLELGFLANTIPFVCLAFCTDYSIFFWTRLQKEREENPTKEMYLTGIVTALRKSSEVIICSSVVMMAAYVSGALYPHMNSMGQTAGNLQLASALMLCGFFSLVVLPAWAACFPSLFDNREPNSPNCIQRCLPAMLTTLPEGKHFWRTWTGFVTRGKMMIIIPLLAYAAMAPFVVCMTLFEPNYDLLGLLGFPGIPETQAYDKMNDHFGAGESVKWVYVLQAKELGPVDNAALLQLDDAGTGPTAEEVAFAQHALKMSRKTNGNLLGEGIVMQPEFGKAVCKFSEQLIAIMKENHYKADATMIQTFWYGKDPFGSDQAGCRSQDQISNGLQKSGAKFDDKFGDFIHKSGDRILVPFFPGLDISCKRSQNLYHVLRDTLETQASHEFVMNGKRYWFEAEHTAPVSWMKETGVDMMRACPWVLGWTAGLAFLGVSILFKSFFLPMKFCMTVVVPLAAVMGLQVAVFQENWFKFLGCNALAQDGGIGYIIPYISIGMIFGLAMDYDIFLFARVYEYRQHGYDNVSSVQKALVETGPIVMTAGTFMCTSFFFMMVSSIREFTQIAFLYFFGVLIDTFITCTCIAPCVLCWGEWLNFFPGYIPPVTKKYNVDDGCDEGSESK